MASTDLPGAAEAGALEFPSPAVPAAAVRALTAADLPDCLALSLSADWNQNESDWRMMLALGRGWGIEATGAGDRRRLAASVVIIPYQASALPAAAGAASHLTTGCAWVSMVLVLPEFRR